MKLTTLLFICLLTAHSAYTQVSLVGQVIDASTGQPIYQATVTDAQTQQLVFSQGGVFTLRQVKLPAYIMVAALGYESQKLWVHEQGGLYIRLSPDAQQLSEVVIQAMPHQIPYHQQSVALSLLTPNELKRDDGILPHQALNRVPGILMHNGTFSTNRLTIRGVGTRTPFGTNKVRTFWGDIPLTDGEGNSVFEDLDLAFVGGIDIIRGTVSGVYGAGLGGALLIKPLDRLTQKVELSSSVSVGSFGLVHQSQQAHLNLKNASLHASSSSIHTDGWRANNAYDRYNATIDYSHYTNRLGKFRLLMTGIAVKGFIPSSLDSATFEAYPRRADTRWQAAKGNEQYERLLVGLTHNIAPINNLLLQNTVYLNATQNREHRPFNHLQEQNLIGGWRGKLEWQTRWRLPLLFHARAPRFRRRVYMLVYPLRFSLGSEVLRDYYHPQYFATEGTTYGELIGKDRITRHLFNAYLSVHSAWSRHINFDAAINYNRTRFELQDQFAADSLDRSASRKFPAQWSPRFGLAAQLNSQYSIYLTYAHGFSTPTLAETLDPGGAINPDIVPETGRNLELGFRVSPHEPAVKAELVFYSLQVRQLLVAERVTEDTYIGRNAGGSSHRGMEFAASYPFAIGRQYRLQAFASLALNDHRFQSFITEDSDFSDNQLPGTPPWQSGAGLELNTDYGLRLNLNYQFVGAMFLDDANSRSSSSYHLLNSKIEYNLTLTKRFFLALHLGVNNLLDQSYAGMLLVNAPSMPNRPSRYFYPALPRNVYGGLSLKCRW